MQKGTSIRLSAAVDVKTSKKSTEESATITTSLSSIQSVTDNPWLDDSVTIKQSSKARALATQADRAMDKLNQKKKNANSKSQSNSELHDTNIDIDLTLDKKNNSSTASKLALKSSDQLTLPATTTTLSSSSDDEDNDNYETHSTKNPNALKQRDLVERAFANDHVVMKVGGHCIESMASVNINIIYTQEFTKEKLAEMEAEEGKEEEESLPGWGVSY